MEYHPLDPSDSCSNCSSHAMDAELTKLLSDADRALGRLDGVATVLPNPDLFVAMYVRQEAVLSSQIEGTQSTLQDVLAYEADANKETQPGDVVMPRNAGDLGLMAAGLDSACLN